MLNMLFQDGFAYLIERGTHRSDLYEHFITVSPFRPQPFEAVGVTGDACKPFSDLLVGWIVWYV